MRVVITGCNRANGIGQEMCRQLLARGDHVEATARDPKHAPELAALARSHPDRVGIHTLDVASDASAVALGKSIAGPIDALVNNAGVWHAERDLDRVDANDLVRLFQINAIGALRVTRALMPHLLEGKTKKILNMSTGMAILGEENNGRAYGYRMSKVALNMMTKTLAANFLERGVVCCVIDPGWVQTDMGGDGAEVPVERSVAGVLAWLDRMKAADSGSFLHYSGNKLPW